MCKIEVEEFINSLHEMGIMCGMTTAEFCEIIEEINIQTFVNDSEGEEDE